MGLPPHRRKIGARKASLCKGRRCGGEEMEKAGFGPEKYPLIFSLAHGLNSTLLRGMLVRFLAEYLLGSPVTGYAPSRKATTFCPFLFPSSPSPNQSCPGQSMQRGLHNAPSG